MDFQQLCEGRCAALDEIVRQYDGKMLCTDFLVREVYGMSKSAGFGLSHHHDVGHIRYLLLPFQQCAAPLPSSADSRSGRASKYAGTLSHAGRNDKDDRLDAASGRFGDGVVDKGRAEDRQQCLWHGSSYRQESGPKPRHRG